MEYEVEGFRQRGRLNRTWIEVVEKDYHARKLKKRGCYGSQQTEEVNKGLFGNQDESEWVKVSSSTGPPGLSRTKGH